MPRFRQLSGDDIIRIFGRFEFEVTSQRGSHIKLRRLVDGHRQTLHVPNHARLDTGTTRAVFRQACEYIPDV